MASTSSTAFLASGASTAGGRPLSTAFTMLRSCRRCPRSLIAFGSETPPPVTFFPEYFFLMISSSSVSLSNVQVRSLSSSMITEPFVPSISILLKNPGLTAVEASMTPTAPFSNQGWPATYNFNSLMSISPVKHAAITFPAKYLSRSIE